MPDEPIRVPLSWTPPANFLDDKLDAGPPSAAALGTRGVRPARLEYRVTATGPGGEPLEGAKVSITDPPGFRYNEYWTGPSPWWKRAWRRLRRSGR